MHFPVRAAGFAALSLAAGYAALGQGDPLRAWRVAAAPVATSWQDHEIAAPAPDTLGLNATDPGAAAAAPPAATETAPEPAPPTLARLVAARAGATPDNQQQYCLASAIYFEAQGESLEGQLAVAEVVLNRRRSPRYPNTVCAVVRQRGQFSFVRGGRIPRADRRTLAWRRAVAIARIAEEGAAPRQVPRDVLWYHARYVQPAWRSRLEREASIGLHIFYS